MSNDIYMNFEDLSNAPNRWSGTAGDGARKSC